MILENLQCHYYGMHFRQIFLATANGKKKF